MVNGYTIEQMPYGKKFAFEWDDANTAHIVRHGIRPEEAEQVVSGGSLPLESESAAEKKGTLSWGKRSMAACLSLSGRGEEKQSG